MPAPYDALNFLHLLGIEVGSPDEPLHARMQVTHDLIAGTGYLWAPAVMTMADALCAFGVSRHWPESAVGFTTVECKSNFFSSAKEGEFVVATAEPVHLGRSTQVWDAQVRNETTERLMAAYRCTQMLLY